MKALTLEQVAQIVGGIANGSATVSSVSADSRAVQSGALFAAIVGERVDGHDFVESALANGAAGALVSKPVLGPHVLVPNSADLDPVLAGLGRLAAWQRGELSATVIGITGSSGKTTTKDLIGQVLDNYGTTVAPAGSPNNELGLPITILNAPDDVAFLVLEMGARGIGHIQYLCDIARPDIAVVTNVGLAHSGVMGGINRIAQAKSELVSALTPNGIAVLNSDDPIVRRMADLCIGQVIFFGRDGLVRADQAQVESDGTWRFTLCIAESTAPIHLTIPGEHNVSNALAAAAVGHAVGMSIEQICAALNSAVAKSKWRMEVHELSREITLINDAYNANPESMAAALKTLAEMGQSRRTWAVLGAMHELGDEELTQHDRIGRLVVRLNISQLVCVGDKAKVLHLAAAMEGSWDGESVWFPGFSEAADYIVERIRPGDVVLFKASRSEGFEDLAALVEKRLEGQ